MALHLVIAAAEKDAIDQLIEIPCVLVSHKGGDHLRENALTQFHLAGMSNGPAFSPISGAGTDEPVAIPFMEVKGVDCHRVR